MNRWFENLVVYQIYPMSFKDSNHDGMGDIVGIIEQLDYLKTLGVDVLWLSPIYQSPMDDNGYDISDYYQIHPMFGTLEEFKKLLFEVHKRGMYLIMDLVVNHTSDEHVWFQEALKDEKSPYRDFYIFRKHEEADFNMRSIFSGSAWEKINDTYAYFHMFSKKQPDLNWKNESLRQAIYKMMNYWLDLGIDGFRMDVIDLIGKDIDQHIFSNGPKLHDYLKEMHTHCFEGRQTITVGETGSVTPEIAIKYTTLGAHELDMVFQFQQVSLDEEKGKDKWHLKPLKLTDLKRVLSTWQTELYQKGWNSLYWSNHDQPRIVSRWGNDQKYRIESAKMLAGILHMMQGTPYIYQGEEIGMTNKHFTLKEELRDIETINMIKEKEDIWPLEKIFESIRAKGRDNARTPMQWDTSIHAGFSDGHPWIDVNPNYLDINVKQAVEDQNSIYYFYKELINLRKQIRCVIDGKYTLINPNDEQFFHFIRENEDESIEVIANFSESEGSYETPTDKDVLMSNYDLLEHLFKPYELRIYYKKKGEDHA